MRKELFLYRSYHIFICGVCVPEIQNFRRNVDVILLLKQIMEIIGNTQATNTKMYLISISRENEREFSFPSSLRYFLLHSLDFERKVWNSELVSTEGMMNSAQRTGWKTKAAWNERFSFLSTEKNAFLHFRCCHRWFLKRRQVRGLKISKKQQQTAQNPTILSTSEFTSLNLRPSLNLRDFSSFCRTLGKVSLGVCRFQFFFIPSMSFCVVQTYTALERIRRIRWNWVAHVW